MMRKVGIGIGFTLVIWGVVGLIITLPGVFKKDWFAAIPVLGKMGQGAQAKALDKMPDSVRIWHTLGQMTRSLKTPPPAVAQLVGQTLDVAGFLIYNEANPDDVREFLLTPVPGGCIHVPPPPPNYIMHVLMEPGKTTKFQYGAVVVHGKLEIPDNPVDRQYYSYQMTALSVSPYHDSDVP